MFILQSSPHILSQTGHLTANDVQWVSECLMWVLSMWSASEDLDHRLLIFYQIYSSLSALCGHIYHPFIYHSIVFHTFNFQLSIYIIETILWKEDVAIFLLHYNYIVKLLYYYCTLTCICWVLLWLRVFGYVVNTLNLRCSVSAANSEEISGINATLPATVVPRWHHCTYVTIPRCFASAWQEGAWATLQFPVHWPASDVLCSERQLVEIWRKCCG